MRGDSNAPEKSATSFSGDWAHNSDLTTIDVEAYITVVDHKKDMVRTDGENVAGRELENMVYHLFAQ